MRLPPPPTCKHDGTLAVEHPSFCNLPPPAVGSLIVVPRPGKKQDKEIVALKWQTLDGRECVRATSRGLLIRGSTKDAYWLPEWWKLKAYPIGWTLAHLEHWFKYALVVVHNQKLFKVWPYHSSRDLVAHAHLLVRHMNLPASPAEPRMRIDQAGCVADLSDVLEFFRRAIPLAEARSCGAVAGRQMESAVVEAGQQLANVKRTSMCTNVRNVRSWTQGDLDKAIREYKAHRASNYKDLVDGVKYRRSGAESAARKLFGRNVIARELGVKSKAMVSKSEAWQEVAQELELSPKFKPKRLSRKNRIGSGPAEEAKGEEDCDITVRNAIANELESTIRGSLGKREADALIARVFSNEITVDQAYEILELSMLQEEDDRRRRSYQSSLP